jgi:hypothetical protein
MNKSRSSGTETGAILPTEAEAKEHKQKQKLQNGEQKQGLNGRSRS